MLPDNSAPEHDPCLPVEPMTARDEAVDRMAQRKYERYDSHFSMPGGLSWEQYKADDPSGAQMYLSDAEDDFDAALPVLLDGLNRYEFAAFLSSINWSSQPSMNPREEWRRRADAVIAHLRDEWSR